MKPDDATPLGDARAWLRARSAKGERCPCCRQMAKVYRRKLGGSMTRVLLAFYRADQLNPNGWQDVFQILKGDGIGYHGSDYAKLSYWGLLESHPERLKVWRITALGRSFVRGEIRVPSHAVVYDGRCLRTEGDLIDVREALGKRFDFNELMGERPRSAEPQ